MCGACPRLSPVVRFRAPTPPFLPFPAQALMNLTFEDYDEGEPSGAAAQGHRGATP